MEHSIKIEVADLGKAAGSLGWLNARLATAKVKIGANKKGALSAWLKYTNPDTGEEQSAWVASVIQDPINVEQQEECGFVKTKNNIQYAYCGRGRAYDGYEYRNAIFDVYLTDAATSKVSEIREKILAQLDDCWENN